MTEEKQKSKVRRGLSIGLHMVIPFWAMRQTYRLAKNEVTRSKEHLDVIRQLSADAKQTLRERREKAESEQQSFSEAINSREPGAMSIPELYRYFLSRKRACQLAALIMGLLAIIGIVLGIYLDSSKGVIQGLLSIATAMPLLFAMALSAQLRLWQLKTQRLSKAEKGGLKDFITENRNWIKQLLDPEYGHSKGGRP
ncbi:MULTISPECIES: hypothetical protein [Pseudomonas syringae group]|uniref:TraX protein n=1 Tax=Pseudomonas meliae TaxID=86176 RepID=A0A0P9ZPU9_9PSED|nr:MULTISPECIES: hypothetical protein [Pseudomonas syringae group]KPX93500.1 TraX protein [Pseudomonas meliae]QOU99754.1 hypothetical protein [Pseudomonas syringae pv. actinidiae]